MSERGPLQPAENMALTIARAQVTRGENPPINITTVLVMALDRLVAGLEAADPMPCDLAAILRDPTIVIERDHEIRLADGRTLAEHMREWATAPSNTASAD